jgi:hypothetical protein
MPTKEPLLGYLVLSFEKTKKKLMKGLVSNFLALE